MSSIGNELNSNLNRVEPLYSCKAASVVEAPEVSKKTKDFLNNYMINIMYPNYFEIKSQRYSVSSVLNQHKDLAPELEGKRSVHGRDLRHLMENNSPRFLSFEPKSQQLKIKSLENQIESLTSAIASTKRDENKNFMLSVGGVRVDLLDTALAVSAVVIGVFVALAIAVNPFFALGLLSLLLIGLALYDAPTDVKRLEEAKANKEKLTQELNQYMVNRAECYRGQFCADLIRDLKKSLEDVNAKLAIEPKPSEFILNKQRVEDLRKQAPLEKAVKELGEMVEFYKIKEQIVSSEATQTGIFADAEYVDAKEKAE